MAAILAAVASFCSTARAQCSPGSLFSAGPRYVTGAFPRHLVLDDFNYDAVLDIAITNGSPEANTVSVLLGNGDPGARDGSFRPGGSFDAGGQALGLARGDFNSDGIRDLAVANGGYGTVSILMGQSTGGVGDGTFAPPVAYAVGYAPGLIAVSDFNGDAIHDLVVGDLSQRWIYLLLGNGTAGAGDGSFVPTSTYPLTTTPTDLTSGDLNGDGLADFVVIGASPQSRLAVFIAKASGPGFFVPPVYYSLGPSPSSVVIEDFNVDGRLDVAVAHRAGGGISVLLGLGAGALGTPATFAPGLSLSSLVAVDVDNNDITDLLAASSPGDQLVFLKGDGTNGTGTGAFGTPVVEAALGPSPRDLAVSDFNGDCADDVAIVGENDLVDPPSNVSILLGRCVLTTCGTSPTFQIQDVPGDQGGFVRLTWRPTSLDGLDGRTVLEYEIWRRISLTESWVRLGEVAARRTALYSTIVPTSRDSIAGDSAHHEFFLRALTANPNLFFDSQIGIGHSVDNLPPPPPARFSGDLLLSGAVRLRWSPSAASDVIEYRLHRGAVSSFIPGENNLIAVAPDTEYVDPAGSPTSSYKISAVDVHGNIGPAVAEAYRPCTPPSCSVSASGYTGAGSAYFTLTKLLNVTRYDTTFYELRTAYDLTQGWVLAYADFAKAPTNLTTTANDVYWLVGAPPGQILNFNASLVVQKYTRGGCILGTQECVVALASASIAEPGMTSSPCPVTSAPCVPLAHRGFEPFTLRIIGGILMTGTPLLYGSATVNATLRFDGLPPGVYVTSCSGYISDPATPVKLSLVRASLEDGFPRITWYSADGSAPRATVYRRTADTDWSRQDDVVADGSGYLVYEDHSTLPGNRYGYRLGVIDEGEERSFGEAWVEVPAAVRLALENVAPNPATGPLEVGFSLPAARPAWLEVFDVGGRRLHAREVGWLGAGPHTMRLEESEALRPGIYLLRLSQDGAFISRRVVKIR